MNKLKYNKELYENSGIFDGDMDCEYINEVQKLIKCRKEHTCCNCRNTIEKGDHAVYDTALFPGDGYRSCYICVSCVESWLEESGQVDSQLLGN